MLGRHASGKRAAFPKGQPKHWRIALLRLAGWVLLSVGCAATAGHLHAKAAAEVAASAPSRASHATSVELLPAPGRYAVGASAVIAHNTSADEFDPHHEAIDPEALEQPTAGGIVAKTTTFADRVWHGFRDRFSDLPYLGNAVSRQMGPSPAERLSVQAGVLEQTGSKFEGLARWAMDTPGVRRARQFDMNRAEANMPEHILPIYQYQGRGIERAQEVLATAMAKIFYGTDAKLRNLHSRLRRIPAVEAADPPRIRPRLGPATAVLGNKKVRVDVTPGLSPDGPVAVAMHGYTGNPADWDPMLKILNEDYGLTVVNLEMKEITPNPRKWPEPITEGMRLINQAANQPGHPLHGKVSPRVFTKDLDRPKVVGIAHSTASAAMLRTTRLPDGFISADFDAIAAHAPAVHPLHKGDLYGAATESDTPLLVFLNENDPYLGMGERMARERLEQGQSVSVLRLRNHGHNIPYEPHMQRWWVEGLARWLGLKSP